MNDLIKYYQRFKNEVIYLWNDTAEAFVKSDPEKGYFAKFKGGKEFSVPANSDTVVLAIDGKNEVTKEEYENA